MKRTIRDQWVAALRSGKYKQGRHYLKLNNTYCCLGVLCEVLGGDITALKATNEQMLSRQTCAEIGLRDDRSIIYEPTSQQHLAKMNDFYKPFPEIANYIETNIPVED